MHMDCEHCRSNPHDVRCPEATERKPIYYCSECKFGIYEGDKFYRIEGKKYCVDCIRDSVDYAEYEDPRDYD